MIYYKDNKFSFVELFNEKTGTLVRSNVLSAGIETDNIPEMRSFPELIDIGIMGSCDAGKAGICRTAGVDCYQSGMLSLNKNMELSEYKRIIAQCKGRTFQVALGGAGDPNKHESFEEILQSTRESNIVPNYTTSGYGLLDCEIELSKRYCGAVAISYYSKLDSLGKEDNPATIAAIRRLVEAGCITNIHYVISKKNIREAVFRVKNHTFPMGINAVIFLLYKPVGRASQEYVLDYTDRDYIELLHLVSSADSSWRYGFDTCQSPALSKYTDNVAKEALEFCEAARFSMYIDAKSEAYPCSFGIEDNRFSVSLRTHTLQEAWESVQFASFRDNQRKQCVMCTNRQCRGCGLDLRIGVCERSAEV